MLDWMLASLNRLIFPFFWGGKVDLIARDVVIQSSVFGGFSLVSVQLNVWAFTFNGLVVLLGASQFGCSSFSIIHVFCMALRQVISCLTRVLLTLVPCLPFIRQSCLPGYPWMGLSLLLLINWSWLPLLFILLSRQSRPSRLTLSFWSSAVVSQLVLEALVVCSALSIGPPLGLSCFGLVLTAQ